MRMKSAFFTFCPEACGLPERPKQDSGDTDKINDAKIIPIGEFLSLRRTIEATRVFSAEFDAEDIVKRIVRRGDADRDAGSEFEERRILSREKRETRGDAEPKKGRFRVRRTKFETVVLALRGLKFRKRFIRGRFVIGKR
jgi:hypothetical protein